MTSRERLLGVLDRNPVDRVPISTYELSGYNTRAFENNEPSYAHLMDVIRERTDCVCMWNPESNATILQSAAAVEIEAEDTREGHATITRRKLETPRGPLTNLTKVLDGIHTVWSVEHWCKSPGDVDAALEIPFVPLDFDYSDLPRIQGEVGDNGIIMASLGDALCSAAELMEFGQYTLWALTETDHFVRTLDALHERIMENLRRMLDGAVVDLYRIFGPEYATPPYLPPACFERFVVPYVSDMVRLIHERGGRARFHSHGQIGKVLEHILATGPVALDPCEPPPDGDIELADLKKRVGDQLCLFGNLELKLLELGNADDVEDAVKNCMAAAKTGGGYVIMPTAAPINVPLAKRTEENYLTFIDAAHRYGGY